MAEGGGLWLLCRTAQDRAGPPLRKSHGALVWNPRRQPGHFLRFPGFPLPSSELWESSAGATPAEETVGDACMRKTKLRRAPFIFPLLLCLLSCSGFCPGQHRGALIRYSGKDLTRSQKRIHPSKAPCRFISEERVQKDMKTQPAWLSG